MISQFRPKRLEECFGDGIVLTVTIGRSTSNFCCKIFFEYPLLLSEFVVFLNFVLRLGLGPSSSIKRFRDELWNVLITPLRPPSGSLFQQLKLLEAIFKVRHFSTIPRDSINNLFRFSSTLPGVPATAIFYQKDIS